MVNPFLMSLSRLPYLDKHQLKLWTFSTKNLNIFENDSQFFANTKRNQQWVPVTGSFPLLPGCVRVNAKMGGLKTSFQNDIVNMEIDKLKKTLIPVIGRPSATLYPSIHTPSLQWKVGSKISASKEWGKSRFRTKSIEHLEKLWMFWWKNCRYFRNTFCN